MSIVTKTGDEGMTALMYGRRVSKCHPRVKAFGEVDELNAALGMARASAGDAAVRENLLGIQRQLVIVMGELATAIEDSERYVAGGYQRVDASMAISLEKEIRILEERSVHFAGWAMPGETAAGAALDLARTVCRRAERQVCELQEGGQLHNPQVLIYLNRLSDFLWLLARSVEADASSQSSRS